MIFRHRYSAPSTNPILSSADVDALDDIRAEWEQRRQGYAPGYGEIIDLALRRMRLDLDSGGEVVGEVIEDLRREIGYRQWCARAASV